MLNLEIRPGVGLQIGEAKIYLNTDQPVKVSIDAPKHVIILRDDAVKRRPS